MSKDILLMQGLSILIDIKWILHELLKYEKGRLDHGKKIAFGIWAFWFRNLDEVILLFHTMWSSYIIWSALFSVDNATNDKSFHTSCENFLTIRIKAHFSYPIWTIWTNFVFAILKKMSYS